MHILCTPHRDHTHGETEYGFSAKLSVIIPLRVKSMVAKMTVKTAKQIPVVHVGQGKTISEVYHV